MTTSDESWEKFLNPETLKNNLIAISLFITAFEMFKDRVVEKPETFFTNALMKKASFLMSNIKQTFSLDHRANFTPPCCG